MPLLLVDIYLVLNQAKNFKQTLLIRQPWIGQLYVTVVKEVEMPYFDWLAVVWL